MTRKYLFGEPLAIKAIRRKLRAQVTLIALPLLIAVPFLGQPASAESSRAAGAPSAMSPATRVLPLEGGRNFRDLGGYPTEDGKSIKWRKVFRSGVLSGLTEADFRVLSDIKIKTILDFRMSSERENAPTNWKSGEVAYLTFPDVLSMKGNPLIDAVKAPDASAESVSKAMKILYRKIAQVHKPMYKEMFAQLAAGQTPMVIFDSAGKNRTGVGAGLLLTALGVPRDIILKDFALSDEVVDYRREMLKPVGSNAEKDQYSWMRKIRPDVIEPFLRSDPAYLEAAFAYMEETSGSVEAFIHRELDVTSDDIKSIRAELLN
ncbi:Tyrosine phosphatase family protein [compost metagenome]